MDCWWSFVMNYNTDQDTAVNEEEWMRELINPL